MTPLHGHNDLCVGIDLGTTNSVAATINEKPNHDIVSKVVEVNRAVDMFNAFSGEVRLSTSKKPTLPSCVYYREERGYAPLVGDFAKMQYPLRPHLVAKSIKSQMGRTTAQGLSDDVPDKTPAQISAQILKHLLKETAKIYKCGEITDAVITVPANFDSAMCKATRDAAELAGIKVRNDDGTERPVLLSEPNAVIYDLINQIHNGEISYHIVDLSEQKNVLVFDLGGGTLDITMHEIKRREDMPDVLKVKELATNRYTLLGGDDFDEAIAREMFARYLKQYGSHPEVLMKLRQNEQMVMPQLRAFAENVKIELNERCGEEYSSGWDEEDEEVSIATGGSMGGIGYAYDDTFTQEELEKILEPFMGNDLCFQDYRRVDEIKDSRNIIYPILDVLKKTAVKLNSENFTVDAVIVNGGMSKFYMVVDRLKDFFGFDPIVALDPDQSVARGAAVYHYYLHKYEEMQDDMRLLGVDSASPVMDNDNDCSDSEPVRKLSETPKPVQKLSHGIEWGKNILNDSLYLGLKMGAVDEIIPTGAELPYKSQIMAGYQMMAGQNQFAVPIKSRNIDGTYRTIANGMISFNKKYPNGSYVAFRIFMGENKVLSMQAWTSRRADGSDILEQGFTTIAIDNNENAAAKTKIISRGGSILRPNAEINNVIQLCRNLSRARSREKSMISKRIAVMLTNICAAANPEDFADVLLTALDSTHDEESRLRLFIIARKLCNSWSDSDKRRFALKCMLQLDHDLMGFTNGGQRVNTSIQAIMALGVCGSTTQLEKLESLHSNTRYYQACMYAHAKSGTCVEWLNEEFERDIRNALRGNANNLQFSSYAMGIAVRELRERGLKDVISRKSIVANLCKVIKSGSLQEHQLICCILALAWICDQRVIGNEYDNKLLIEIEDMIRYLEDYYPFNMYSKCEKSRNVAMKLIHGENLNQEEEDLLMKVVNW